jgi:hypothetical protein
MDLSETQNLLAAIPYVMYDKHFSRNFDFVENVCLLLQAFEDGKLVWTFGVNAIADVLGDLSIQTGIQDTRTLFLEQVFGKIDVEYGHPITKVGEGYLSAGWVGVMFYGLLGGALSAVVFKRLIIERTLGEASAALYISVLMNFGVAHANGYVWSPVVLGVVSISALAALATVLLGYSSFRYRSLPAVAP